MSRQSNTNQKKCMSSATQKKFCKVCFDAKKSEAEYTSHFVREKPEPGSKVTCPILLAAVCGYCQGMGHTPSACSILKEHQKSKKREEVLALRAKSEASKPVKNAEKTPTCGGFAALMDESSDSENEEKQVKVAPVSNKKINSVKVPFEPKSDTKYTELFPSLTAVSVPAAQAKVTATAKSKPQFLAAIEQSCPGIKVGAKTPEINTYRPVTTKLVRPQKEEAAYVQGKPSEVLLSDFIEEEEVEVKAEVRKPMKASEMDWAQLYDSDDEDW